MALHLRIALLYYPSMNISEYLCSNKITQASFADLVGVSIGMVNQWLTGNRPVSPEKCVIIEKITNGEVTRKDLRPNDWQAIWPELQPAA